MSLHLPVLAISFENAIVLLNVVFALIIVGFILYRVFSLRRNPEPRPPLNIAPGMADDVLEGRKLERVLGWALLFTIILAVALPMYFLFEPTREAKANDTFLKQSIVRGGTLFANNQSPYYDATTSLLCANCHGVHGEGGSTAFTLQPEADLCQIKANQSNPSVPQCLPQQVAWQAPALNTVLYRFDTSQLSDIITYGRPGTPMPAWGVASGKGVLGPQGIQDLVNYIQSIQIPLKKAQQEATAAIGQYKQQAQQLVSSTQGQLTTAQQTVATAQAQNQPASVVSEDQLAVTALQGELASAQASNTQIQGLSDGAILFRVNCARCHTQNWSFYDPTKLSQPAPCNATAGVALPDEIACGAYGPSLNNGRTLVQFPNSVGLQEQIMWVTQGVPANQQYGIRGISSGRMPHFGSLLTTAQIAEIVNYERGL
jgi:mono/diheme cytochrome c family protein/cytochrome c553